MRNLTERMEKYIGVLRESNGSTFEKDLESKLSSKVDPKFIIELDRRSKKVKGKKVYMEMDYGPDILVDEYYDKDTKYRFFKYKDFLIVVMYRFNKTNIQLHNIETRESFEVDKVQDVPNNLRKEVKIRPWQKWIKKQLEGSTIYSLRDFSELSIIDLNTSDFYNPYGNKVKI